MSTENVSSAPMGSHTGAHKVVLGTYSTHDAAQHAVDLLAEHNFPVEHVTIVGTGLRLEEQVTGRWTLPRAVIAGAGTGGWIGLLIGLVFWIVSPWAVGAVISAILLGLLFGVVFAAIAHGVQRRTFTTVSAIVADRYDVMVDAEFAEEARRVLAAALSATDPAADQPS
ncbi:general stress protein [Actinomadura alba]|nr:general stress protein [Actinomadura alba]